MVWRTLVAVLVLCAGCGFDLRITIGMDPRYGYLRGPDGERLDRVTIEESYDSIGHARGAPPSFEVSDTSGLHVFDLRPFIRCPGDEPDPPRLEVFLQLTYATACIPEPSTDGDTLRLCWSGSRCGDISSVP